MIQTDSLFKTYENANAVCDLSFSVQPGQVLGLVGRNGAGKTTTLKTIAGLIPASSGSVKIAGHDLETELLEVKRHSAYVPDDPELFSDLTVEQHLLFTAGVYGNENPFEAMGELLETFELSEKRHTVASGLSRGMRQKLAIICAHLQQPAALLLDEPMTGLDPQGIRRLKDTITQQAKSGSAVIISSHLLAMVEDICTHVLILETGKRQFFGSLDELKQQFASTTNDETKSLEEIYFATIGMKDSMSSLATDHSGDPQPNKAG